MTRGWLLYIIDVWPLYKEYYIVGICYVFFVCFLWSDELIPVQSFSVFFVDTHVAAPNELISLVNSCLSVYQYFIHEKLWFLMNYFCRSSLADMQWSLSIGSCMSYWCCNEPTRSNVISRHVFSWHTRSTISLVYICRTVHRNYISEITRIPLNFFVTRL
jgi:uncharacterized membrane protein